MVNVVAGKWRNGKLQAIDNHFIQQDMKQIVKTDKAPLPIGPYSQAVVANGMVFVSGQIAIDPATGQLNNGDLAAQAALVMKNLEAVLRAADSSFARVVKTSIFLAPGEDFDTVNQIYNGYFEKEYPARETVWVHALPKGVRVEISLIALVGSY